MITLLILKYFCSFLLGSIIKSFSKKLGMFILIKGYTFLNLLYSLFVNLGIIYISTFIYWEIFRIFENEKIIKFCKIFPKFISLQKDSIIPPGFMLHWRLLSLRMFYALLLTSIAESSYLLIQYLNPFIAFHFTTFFTYIYFITDFLLSFIFEWEVNPPISHDNITNEDYLVPPFLCEEIQKVAEEKMKQDNAILEQKKTLYRGFFSMSTVVWIVGITFCDTLYIFFKNI